MEKFYRLRADFPRMDDNILNTIQALVMVTVVMAKGFNFKYNFEDYDKLPEDFKVFFEECTEDGEKVNV